VQNVFQGCRGFIIAFTRRATDFHRQAKLFKLNLLIKNISARWSNQVGKILLAAAQFALCSVLNGTPEDAMKF